ncbi:doublecortin domain-containing protein 2-like [Echeneis naucrates]|uniref:doublecortin domain-containing protein 2-like n=1 Tax=Echeneis naucrates TaxID=173247 RepID=UPI00111392E6|nr:doublecortin domain-containing protein 2 [Echeneis naucrates]
MSSEKPNFLAQPVVKNIFMFRNGDPYYEARRIVINQKRVSTFETLLMEVTGGIKAPFGAVRNIYTPRGGHKVDCLESLQSGEQYVAAGGERFKKLDYLQIGSRKRRMLQTLQAKPLPQNRIIVSARFLKPIKEPCRIFVVANGDVLNPATRLLIHQRMLSQFDKILEMITEKMGLRVLGGVRSLYTDEGHQLTDGNQLESGQLYVAVGREKFKKLSYSDLLFTKPRGLRRVDGMKAYSLPPIYRFSKQSGNNKSTVHSSGDGDSKTSPPHHGGHNKDQLSSIVREISQARLMSFRKRRSGQRMTLSISDTDDPESKAGDGNSDNKTPDDPPAEEKPAVEDTKPAQWKEQVVTGAENTTEEDMMTSKKEKEKSQETTSEKEGGEEKESQETTSEKEGGEEKESQETTSEKEGGEEKESQETTSEKEGGKEKESQETTSEKEGGEEKKEMEESSNEKEGEATEEEEEVQDEGKEEVTVESEEGFKTEEQEASSSNTDKSQEGKEKEDGSHTSSEGEKDEQSKYTEEEVQDKDSRKGEENEDQHNDVDTEEEQKETESSNDPGKTQADNETKDTDNGRSNSRNSNQEQDGSQTREETTKESGDEERKVNGEVGGEDDEVQSEAELDKEEKNSASHKDATESGEKAENPDKENQDNRKEKD